MRELLSRKDLTESLYVLDSDYFINIDEAVKSLFQARTIIRKYLKQLMVLLATQWCMMGRQH